MTTGAHGARSIPDLPTVATEEQRALLLVRAIGHVKATRRNGGALAGSRLPDETAFRIAWLHLEHGLSAEQAAASIGALAAATPAPAAPRRGRRTPPRAKRSGRISAISLSSLKRWLEVVREAYDHTLYEALKGRAEEAKYLGFAGDPLQALAANTARAAATLAGLLGDTKAFVAMEVGERNTVLRLFESIAIASKTYAEVRKKDAETEKLRDALARIKKAVERTPRGKTIRREEILGVFHAALLGQDPADVLGAGTDADPPARPARSRKAAA